MGSLAARISWRPHASSSASWPSAPDLPVRCRSSYDVCVSKPKPLVAVLLGGPSTEHDVSLSTGSLVLERLDRSRFEAAPVYIDKKRVWHFPKLPHPPELS